MTNKLNKAAGSVVVPSDFIDSGGANVAFLTTPGIFDTTNDLVRVKPTLNSADCDTLKSLFGGNWRHIAVWYASGHYEQSSLFASPVSISDGDSSLDEQFEDALVSQYNFYLLAYDSIFGRYVSLQFNPADYDSATNTWPSVDKPVIMSNSETLDIQRSSTNTVNNATTDYYATNNLPIPSGLAVLQLFVRLKIAMYVKDTSTANAMYMVCQDIRMITLINDEMTSYIVPASYNPGVQAITVDHFVVNIQKIPGDNQLDFEVYIQPMKNGKGCTITSINWNQSTVQLVI